ncbi:autophagy protein [Coemansia sp. RSA 1722]|nr:autophagy protein [Coemansia sp. RSA 1722]
MAAVPNFRKTLMAHRMGNERPENLQRPKSKDKASDTAASKPKRTRKKAAAAALAILLQARPDHANVLGSAWKDLAGDPTSIDTMLQTLPEERCKDLALMLTNRGQSKSIVELSRFFSQSLRTDTVSRLPDGGIVRKTPAAGGLMRGSMALVLDGKGMDAGRRGNSNSPVSFSDAEGTASGELVAGGNSGSQGDSFIILSSSQLKAQPLSQPLVSSAFDYVSSPPLLNQQQQQSTSSTSSTDQPMGAENVKDSDIAETFENIGVLMDKLQEKSALNHPMCEDCAETMLRFLDREIVDCVRENNILEGIGKAAEMALKKNDTRDVGELEKELERQADLERALEETLGTLDAQLEGICAQIQQLDKESDELDMMEARANQELNDKGYVLERCEAEQWALDDRYARLAAQLTQLQRTNVFNDVFNISVSEGVASINGFRLGGRSSHGVEWPEINAAWGQALLLLQTVARRLGYEFIDYRLVAMGSFSRIERTVEPMATYELFGSGDLYLGRLFQSRRFDSAMVAFLACLDQIGQLIMSINPQLRIPYRIEQDKIGGVSIRPQFGQDDVWTRACKNTLMDARWALAFASAYSTSDAD